MLFRSIGRRCGGSDFCGRMLVGEGEFDGFETRGPGGGETIEEAHLGKQKGKIGGKSRHGNQQMKNVAANERDGDRSRFPAPFNAIRLLRGGHSASSHDADQMGTIVSTAMDVAVEALGTDLNAFQGIR